MVRLSDQSFHAFVASQGFVACVFHRGPAPADDLAEAVPGRPDGDPWAWATIDVSEAPEVAGMFGVAEPGPHILVMRERVVLYCGPAPATGAEVNAMLDRAARLDMAQVRSEIAQERAGRAALFGRRVCPTAWRQR